MASSAAKTADELEDTGVERQPEVQFEDVLFSELADSVCYWATVLLLAIAGAYLIRWWLTHPGPYAEPVNDPWGIATPPWLILPLAPAGVIGSLGHAAWCAARGHRTWKTVLTAASLILVMGCSKLVETLLAAM